VPAFGAVEDAVRALAAVCAYVRWRRSPHDPPPHLDDVDPAAARSLLMAALEDHPDGGRLEPVVIAELLGCYGIEVWPEAAAGGVEEAVAAAERIGYPVVLKSANPSLEQRSDLGGVRLDLTSENAVRRAYAAMVEAFGEQVGSDLVVQKMAGRGVACVLETVEDALFGPVVSFGVGGVVTELVGDRAHRIPPLSAYDASELVRAPRAAPLLSGHRGAPAMDLPALEQLVVRLGQLAYDLPELARLTLSPVLALPQGVAVVSAAAWVAPPLVRRDGPARRLG
jgi:acyl-CoA synthetase (NDP forming)